MMHFRLETGMRVIVISRALLVRPILPLSRVRYGSRAGWLYPAGGIPVSSFEHGIVKMAETKRTN
jgi:hypothetical protein